MKFEQPENSQDMFIKDSIQEKSVFTMVKKETRDQKILSTFTPEQQIEIQKKQSILSSLAYFIGKDFKIPIELNSPGAGWHWDFKHNIIRIDPKDLLEKPMDYLRFVISHEGGHVRISHFDFIPPEIWQKKGFSFLMNAIEDPRMNNFVSENYPKFREQMKLAYNLNEAEVVKFKTEAKDQLGYQPRFMQAGFEYIRQWFKEIQDKKFEISSDLPEDVKNVVKKTLVSAQDAWWRYPTKEEADKSQENITAYAKVAYEIVLEEIWPEFQKLIEADLEDQKMSELMKDLEKNKQQGREGEIKDSKEDKNLSELPKELKDKLTSEEQKEFEEAIDKAINEAKKESEVEKEQKTIDTGKENKEGKVEMGDEKSEKKGEVGKIKAVNIESLSPELRQKIKDYIDSLSEDEREELAKKAEKALKDFEEKINKEMEGKLLENQEEKLEREKKEEGTNSKEKIDLESREKTEKINKDSEEILERVRKSLEGSEDEYQKEMNRLAPQIKSLKEKLAEIFQERRKRGIRSGFEEGEEIDIEKRLQEKAKGVSIFESKAWRRTELPREKDYAISLLVDLSGSMQGLKIGEAFDATILFTEVLNSLGIKNEILGFNIRIYEYQKFNEKFSNDIRKKIITMKNQVNLPGNEDNDDGWAVEEAVKRLGSRKEKEKLLLVISDGEPDPSSSHNGPEYELGSVVEKIIKEGKVKVVGLGLGSSGISAVKQFYPRHLLANSLEEMIEKIGDLLLEVIKG